MATIRSRAAVFADACMNMSFAGRKGLEPNDGYPLSPRLRLLWAKSFQEEGYAKVPQPSAGEDICLFPRSFVENVQKLASSKDIDYCFRGAIQTDTDTTRNREWVLEFAKKRFTGRSYFQATDQTSKSYGIPGLEPGRRLGPFDFTGRTSGFVPKEAPKAERAFFDAEYFQILCRSEFTLCPAGDAQWSMRFFEAIMAGSIPIVQDIIHTGRNRRERGIGYLFHTADEDDFQFKQTWADHNSMLFTRYQTLMSA